nr:LacI family DNA-binding transcriptional regulator [Frondihabitans sp. PAMC 28766]
MTTVHTTAQEDAESAARATLSEVAETAGVSISTVSKVLNGRSGVSLDTRQKVSGILRDRQYNRRNSTTPSAPLLELVCHALDSPWMVEVVIGVERIARESGLSLVVTGMKDRTRPADSWIEGVLQRQPAGVILVISDIPEVNQHQLRSHGIPFVMVDPEGDPASDVPSIGSANWMGGFMATRHLIELGHREIAFLPGPEFFMAATARLSGYRAALAGAGVPNTPASWRPTASSTWRPDTGSRWRCSAAPTGRPRSSPRATCRPWASTRPPGRST